MSAGAGVDIIEIALGEIDMEDRLRAVDLAEVDKIAISMKLVGQINPIEVRKDVKIGRYILVSGAHRMAAASAIQLPTIKAVIFEGSAEDARLREIDENLCRHELTPFDQANSLAERRTLWERMHGQVRRGGDRRSKGQIVPLSDAVRESGFFPDTAKKFGLSQKTVKRALTRKANIDPAVWAALAGTYAAKNASLIDKLRKIAFDEQAEVLEVMKERGCKMDVAIRLVTAVPAADQSAVELQALRKAWGTASDATRKIFLDEVGRRK